MAECGKWKPSDMRHRVIIQERQRTSDGAGGYTEAWVTFKNAWCSIQPATGYEKYQAQQMQTPISHKIKMRYQSGITTKHRILFGTRIFDLKEVLNENEEGAFLRIKAIEQA